jgi:hypothetical protein
VVSMNMEFGDHMNKITFEVYVYKPWKTPKILGW